MRVVLQRVSSAEVRVSGTVVGKIGQGHVLLVGFRAGDGEEQLRWMADKVLGLRVFPDADGRMNLSLLDIEGELLIVSQFTLYGDTRKGRRPSFIEAAPPDIATPLYQRFIEICREASSAAIETGTFGAEMEVDLVNDGPVTLVLERA